MNWECPKCGRVFKRENQSHSCEARSVDIEFSGKRAKWRSLYDELYKAVASKLPPFSIYCPSVGVQWRHTSTFAFIKSKTEGLFVEFLDINLRSDIPVVKHLRTSANRVIHCVYLREENEIDTECQWIVDSYNVALM